ncbi:hypothetical protein [Methylorubrum aminovorans]
MTTARQVRQLVRPLLERHPDLTLVNSRTLMLVPISHVTKEIWIDRTSSALYFTPQWTLNPLFLPYVKPITNAGFCWEYIYRSADIDGQGRGWCWDDPEMPKEFITKTERVIKLLRGVDTLHACRSLTEAAMDYTWGKDCFENLVYDIALGNLNLARCWWQEVEASPELQHLPQEGPWRTWNLRIRSLGKPLMDDNRAALAAILHRWERENVACAKVEAIWAPTPFPLEEAG